MRRADERISSRTTTVRKSRLGIGGEYLVSFQVSSSEHITFVTNHLGLRGRKKLEKTKAVGHCRLRISEF